MWNKDKKLFELLNIHYNLEQAACNAYMNYSSKANIEGYVYTAKFFRKLANDKINAHLPRLFDFFSSLSQELVINQYSLPKQIEFKSIHDLVKETLNNELHIRKHINYISEYALSIKDLETFNELQWFIKDAIKDVNDVSDILNYFDAANSNMLSIESMVRTWLKDNDEDEE